MNNINSDDDRTNDPHTDDATEGGRRGDRMPDTVAGHADRPRQSPMARWLGSSAADLLGPQLVLATQDQGYTAALNGDHVSTCPWMAAEDDRDVALRQMWIRGYSAARTDLRIARSRQQPPE